MDDVPLSNLTDQSYGAAHGLPDNIKVTPSDTRSDSARKKNKLTLTMSAVGSLIAISFTIYIIVLSFFKSYSLFSWHPALMTFGTLFLMGEAVMAMSQDNIVTGKLGRSSRIQVHWILQALAASLIFIGFLIIVVNKNLNNKHHFHSWHAIFGLVTVIMVAMTSSGGVAALYSIRIKQFIQPALMKLIHNIAGILTYLCGTFCIILAMFSGWFEKHAEYTTQVICVILIIVVAMCTLESAMRSAYNRIQQTIQRL